MEIVKKVIETVKYNDNEEKCIEQLQELSKQIEYGEVFSCATMECKSCPFNINTCNCLVDQLRDMLDDFIAITGFYKEEN